MDYKHFLKNGATMINWPDLPDICCDMRFVDVTEQVKQLLEENDVPYEIKELPIKSRKIPYFGPHPSTLDTSIESLLEYINSGFEVYGWDKFVFEKASWVSGC